MFKIYFAIFIFVVFVLFFIAFLRNKFDHNLNKKFTNDLPSISSKDLLEIDPDTYFKILLNLSRFSDYNIIIKNEYLDEVDRFLSSLKNNKNQINKFLDINNGYNHSYRWKERIENRLKKIPINV